MIEDVVRFMLTHTEYSKWNGKSFDQTIAPLTSEPLLPKTAAHLEARISLWTRAIQSNLEKTRC